MEPKCLHLEEVLVQVKKTLAISITVGLFTGGLLFLLCWIVYKKYLLPRFEQSSKITTDNSTASARHQLSPIHKKPLLPPHKKVKPQGSSSTTSSTASHPQEVEMLPSRDEQRRDEAHCPSYKTRPRPPVQWGQSLSPTITINDEDSTSTYLHMGAASSLPQEQQESHCMYDNLDNSGLNQQHNSDNDLYVQFSKNSPQVEDEPVYENCNQDYENLALSGVNAWPSNHTITEHGYLFMGKAPHEKKRPNP